MNKFEYKPFDFVLTMQCLAAIDYLTTQSDQKAISETESELLKTAFCIFSIIDTNPNYFRFIEHSYNENFRRQTFEESLHRLMPMFHAHSHYLSGLVISNAFLRNGEFEKAQDFMQHALTKSREIPQEEEKQINDHSTYDINLAHLNGAQQVCHFALSGFWTKLKDSSLNVIDIGCGTGLNTEFIIRYTNHLTGLDIDLTSLTNSGRKKRYDRLFEGDAQSNLWKVDGKGDKDLIISTGTIYFFKELEWLFENANRLLTKDGQIVFNSIVTPDDSDVWISRSGNYRYCHSKRHMQQLADKFGFKIADCLWTNCYGIPYWILKFKRTNM